MASNTTRDPKRDPVKGDVLVKWKRTGGGDMIQDRRREVVDGKAGSAPWYVLFNETGETELRTARRDRKGGTVGLSGWRAWAAGAIVEKRGDA